MASPERPEPEGLRHLPLRVALRVERGLLGEVWRQHGTRLLLVFVGLLLPMWAFAELADEIHEREPLAFDEPLLLWARSLASPLMDRWQVAITDAGYLHAVVPLDVVLVLALLLWRRLPEATFAAIALVGSALLNVGTKLLFARERPLLWEPITPELTYSFPSGHAMGSATLGWVLLLLAWRTRWRVPVLLAVVPFTLLVGFSRVYLGVHYPSDILAGWAAASVWTAASYFAVFRFRGAPWQH